MLDLVGNPEDRFSHNEAQNTNDENMYLHIIHVHHQHSEVGKMIASTRCVCSILFKHMTTRRRPISRIIRNVINVSGAGIYQLYVRYIDTHFHSNYICMHKRLALKVHFLSIDKHCFSYICAIWTDRQHFWSNPKDMFLI